MTDILLVQPPSPDPMREHVQNTISCPPLGLGYIASVLIICGFDLEIIDADILHIDAERLRSEIQRHDPKIVGISASTQTYKNALKVARISKETNPEIKTVLGGPHVTFTFEECLSHPQVDIVVRNEGELTMLELCRLVLKKSIGRLEGIKGITYRENGKVISNLARPLIHDLDALPFPAKHLLPLHLYKIPGNIITGRGCPGKCIFCAAAAMSGGAYRFRSAENVIAEMKTTIELFGIKFFFIVDDTFTVLPERTKVICHGLRKLSAELGSDIQWACESRVDTVSKGLLMEMAQAGCTGIQYGVESGSQRILNSIRKAITIEQIENAVRWASEAGIGPVCSFMVPHPQDSRETINETKKLLMKLRRMGALTVVGVTTPFPGTYLYTHSADLGITLISNDTDEHNLVTPVITTENLTVDEIREAYVDLTLASKA